MSDLFTSIEHVQLVAAFAILVAMLAWETARPFFDQFREARRLRGVHLLRNLAIGGINSLLIAAGFVGAWLIAATWAEEHGFGILNLLTEIEWLPGAVHIFGAILLLDAWTYLWHRINHLVPFFWRFHRVHHADAQMDVSTASRFHVGEIFFSSLLRIPLIVLLGVHVWELLLYETMMFAVVQFHHANIAIPEKLDRILRLAIVTPAMHKVHHSRWQPETDSNYSAFLSIWDRMFGSFRTRENLEEIRLGLDEFDTPEDATFTGLMKMPLAPSKRRSAVSKETKNPVG